MKTKLVLLMIAFFTCSLSHSFSQLLALKDTAVLKKEIEDFISTKRNHQIEVVDDTAKLFSVLGDEYWSTNETGKTAIRKKAEERKSYKSDSGSINLRRANVKEIRLAYEITELLVRPVAENLVLANFKLIQHTFFNGEPCTKMFRVTELEQKAGTQWQTLSRHETIIPGTPFPYANTDTTKYKDYAGEYRLLSNVIYKITLQYNKLMWGRGATSRIELIPEDEHTFVMNGREFYRIRFEKNKQGIVTHMRMIEFPGVEYSAIKLSTR